MQAFYASDSTPRPRLAESTYRFVVRKPKDDERCLFTKSIDILKKASEQDLQAVKLAGAVSRKGLSFIKTK